MWSRLHLQAVRPHASILNPSKDELLDYRAAQRTYEGAYLRTSLEGLSYGLIILKIFSHEFYPIGLATTVSGILNAVIAIYRRRLSNKSFQARREDTTQSYFLTSGSVVILQTLLSVITFVVLFVLILSL